MIPSCCFHGIFQCTVTNTEFGVIHTFVTHTSEQNIYCTLYYIYSVYTHNTVCRTLTSQQDPLLIVGLYNFHCKHIFATFPLSLNEYCVITSHSQHNPESFLKTQIYYQFKFNASTVGLFVKFQNLMCLYLKVREKQRKKTKHKHLAAGCHLQCLPDNNKEPLWFNFPLPAKMKKSSQREE